MIDETTGASIQYSCTLCLNSVPVLAGEKKPICPYCRTDKYVTKAMAWSGGLLVLIAMFAIPVILVGLLVLFSSPEKQTPASQPVTSQTVTEQSK